MKRSSIAPALVVLVLVLGAAESSNSAPWDLKKSIEKKANEAIEKAKQKKVAEPATPATSETSSAAPKGKEQKSEGDSSVSAVSTKFDFVTGDKVLLMDDFTRDELGEFPSRWKLFRGNFDVVDFKGERWLRLNGAEGLIAIKSDGLPAKWTLEFDTYQPKMTGPVFTIGGLLPGSPGYVWFAAMGQRGGTEVYFQGPGSTSYSPVPGPNVLNGRRHVSVMAQGASVKIYVDRERIVNVPEMPFAPGSTPAALGFQCIRSGDADPLITNVRFAEGGKSKVDMMSVPFVTHGIVFDTGSDRVKPESAPVLRQISAYLKENAAVKVMITGHTDNVGTKAANKTLSEKRATAVAASLVADYGIDTARLATSGKGDTAPMAPNDSPEGRATNRRVEFSKH